MKNPVESLHSFLGVSAEAVTLDEVYNALHTMEGLGWRFIKSDAPTADMIVGALEGWNNAEKNTFSKEQVLSVLAWKRAIERANALAPLFGKKTEINT